MIYDAMKPMLYTREPEVLSSLYPAITQVAQVLDADPAKAGKLQGVSFVLLAGFVTHQAIGWSHSVNYSVCRCQYS